MTHQESLGGGTRVEPRARVRDAASEDDGTMDERIDGARDARWRRERVRFSTRAMRDARRGGFDGETDRMGVAAGCF